MRQLHAAISLMLLTTVCHASDRVKFNRDIRPILAEHCWQCHGYDAAARQADLRLDQRTAALRELPSGHRAIVAGQAASSELIARVVSHNVDIRMPPADTGGALTAQQIQLLRTWIDEGAEYEQHWSFQPIVKPNVPRFEGLENPIDAFVASRLQEAGLSFAPPAAPEALMRRVSFDLVGLPPTIEELSRLSETPYEEIVDRRLASPHFGERMAVDWLDAARFADTHGYFGDRPREMWLWRDWVIDSFNRNMPFDQFTREQLAGDLLPEATISERIATGFNRNHMYNDETGLIDEEYRVEYVVDRVDTTMSTWLGLTVGCAQCHDHKFDPISQREYYELFAFFNQVPEKGLLSGGTPALLIPVATAKQQQESSRLAQAAADAAAVFASLRGTLDQQQSEWESTALEALPNPPHEHVIHHESFDEESNADTRAIGTTPEFDHGIRRQSISLDATRHLEVSLGELDLDQPWTIGFWLNATGSLSCPISKIESDGKRRGLEVLWQKGRLNVNCVEEWGVRSIEMTTQESAAARQWHHIVISHDGSRRASGVHIFVNGTPSAVDVSRDTLSGSMNNTQPLRIGRRDSGLGFYGQLDEVRVVTSNLTADEVAEWCWSERIRGILERPVADRSAADSDMLSDHFIDRFADATIQDARRQMKLTAAAQKQFNDAIPKTLIMQDVSPPRQTFILERGKYDRPLEPVQPGVPASLVPWPVDAPRNRLGFAMWLTSRDNPLTARVAVNRLWQQCFGEGLVRTVNDFGTQGESPSHPELLDWLAATFQESGWDVKSMLKLIVTSRTYRQSSALTVTHGEVFDPENRLLARGPSFRLPVEMIRDQALATSGLLVRTIGGPSVKPWQPPGLWEEVSYNGEETYKPDAGAGLWRRSLYSYVKRQAPPPALMIFDGPTREKCTLRRARTNTPLQALLLLNDETYLESARILAEKLLVEVDEDSARMDRLWQQVLTRTPTDHELRLLLDLLERQRMRFTANTDEALTLLRAGSSAAPNDRDISELAAWTIVVHTLFNLDETITRR